MHSLNQCFTLISKNKIHRLQTAIQKARKGEKKANTQRKHTLYTPAWRYECDTDSVITEEEEATEAEARGNSETPSLDWIGLGEAEEEAEEAESPHLTTTTHSTQSAIAAAEGAGNEMARLFARQLRDESLLIDEEEEEEEWTVMESPIDPIQKELAEEEETEIGEGPETAIVPAGRENCRRTVSEQTAQISHTVSSAWKCNPTKNDNKPMKEIQFNSSKEGKRKRSSQWKRNTFNQKEWMNKKEIVQTLKDPAVGRK